MNFIKLRCTYKKREVYHYEFCLCSFGPDLYINNYCNNDYHSRSELGNSYEKLSTNERFSLAGSYYFKVLEIEVYKVL